MHHVVRRGEFGRNRNAENVGTVVKLFTTTKKLSRRSVSNSVGDLLPQTAVIPNEVSVL